MFFASVSMRHAVHVKERDFFEVQLTFVFADGLGSGGTGLLFVDQADAFCLAWAWVKSAIAATCSSWRAIWRWWR